MLFPFLAILAPGNQEQKKASLACLYQTIFKFIGFNSINFSVQALANFYFKYT